MHPEAKRFVEWVKSRFPDFFQHKRVLDVGSGDINGCNRYLFEFCEYTGNDVVEAKNVTIVSRTKDLPFPDSYFDTIISTECFEHDPELFQSLQKILAMLKPGGLFCFTCATTGRPEHGTRRTSPDASFGTRAEHADMQDYYQNVLEEDVVNAMNLAEHFSEWRFYVNEKTYDLYFFGLKRVAIPSMFPEYHDESVIVGGGK